MQLKPDDTVDERYKILSQLGQGAFSTVYLARQIDLNREVAIKILNTTIDSEAKLRFKRESQILSTLNNRSLLRCYGEGMLEGHPYLVLEYAKGETLQERLASGPIPIELSLRLVLQVCEALQCIHKLGIVHRDVKPANIMLMDAVDKRQPRIKLLDFGLARFTPLWDKPTQHLTQPGTAIGTVLYMSPEQCRGDNVDQGADIYAAGCLLFHCLTGSPPYEEQEAIMLMHRHLHDAPPMLPCETSSGEVLSPLLQKVLDRAMAKQPQDRYASAQEFIEDLNSIAPQVLTTSAQFKTIEKKSAATPPHRAKRLATKTFALPSLLIGLTVLALTTLIINQKRAPMTRSVPEIWEIQGQALSLIEHEKYDQALSLLDNEIDEEGGLVSLSKTTYPLALRHAEVLRLQRRFPDARQYMSQLQRSVKPNLYVQPATYLELAKLSFAEGDDRMAQMQLERAFDVCDKKSRCRVTTDVGLIELTQHRYRDGLLHLKSARQLNPIEFRNNSRLSAGLSMISAAAEIGDRATCETEMTRLEQDHGLPVREDHRRFIDLAKTAADRLSSLGYDDIARRLYSLRETIHYEDLLKQKNVPEIAR